MFEPASAHHEVRLRRSPELIDRHRSQLLVIDVQEKLVPVICESEPLLETIGFLTDAANALSIPVFVSEQYPQGLGATVLEITRREGPRTLFEKLRFSAAEGFQQHCGADGNPGQDKGRNQVVVAGIEAHVCVLQTAVDLLAQGLQVYVVEDGVGSRHQIDQRAALRRIRDAGGVVCTAESVAFEWCEVAGTEEFRLISRLVRARDAKRKR